jgi:hypothetical protein
MNDLSKKVVEISVEYLGPAGEVFITQQLQRLKKPATLNDFSASQIDELAAFCKQAGNLYIDKATEFAQKIKSLKGEFSK